MKQARSIKQARSMKQAIVAFFLSVSVVCLGVTARATQPLAGDNMLVQEPVVCPLAEPMRVGVYNWPASQVMTGVLSRLLELAYGCPVEVLETLPHSLEMALVRGDIDVLIGVSSVSASTPLRDALAAGDVATANILYQQQAGFFVSEIVYASLAEGQVSELVQHLLRNASSVDANVVNPTALNPTALNPAEAAPGVSTEAAASAAERVPDETGETNTPANEATSSDTAVNSAITSTTGVEDDANTTEATTESASDATSAVANNMQEATSGAAVVDLLSTLPSAFVNCPTRWQCHEINANKLTAYGFDMSVTTPESAAAVVATLQAAQREQQPWFGFLWTPSWLVPTFSLVRLVEPAYSDTCWQADRACAYPADDVLVLWRPEFAAQLPEDMHIFLEQMQFASVLSELLAVQQQAMSNDATATAEDTINLAVAHFLRTYPEQWQAWLEPAVAARVDGAIQSSVPRTGESTATDEDAAEEAAEEATDIVATDNENASNESTD